MYFQSEVLQNKILFISPPLFKNKFKISTKKIRNPAEKIVIFLKLRMEYINTKYVIQLIYKGVIMKKPDLNNNDSKKRLTFREIFDLVQKHEEINRRNTKNKRSCDV